jgi:hypothetical protein
MKINSFSLTICLSAFLLFSCKKDDTLITEGEFSVLTYNVAGLPEGVSSSHPYTYSDSIGKLLNDYDIVHVQEDFCYHDRIIRNVKLRYQTETSGCVPFGDGLNTYSKYPFFNFERTKWRECNGTDCLTPKGFSYSQIVIAPNHSIDFYNVHCNAGSEYMDLFARRKNITQLCDYIKSHSEGKAVIIMGDTNCRYTRGGDTIREILSLGFEDVWIKLIRNNSIPILGDPSLMDCEPNPTSEGCEVVDKIFYRSSAEVELTPISYQHDDVRFYYTNGSPLSDHAPTSAKFRFKIIQ